MGETNTLGLREFATHLGVKPGYVTELKQAGRLVLTEDGKRVRVAESIRLIAETRDPSKAGVSARHAAARGQVVNEAPPSSLAAAAVPEAEDEPEEPANPHSLRRSKALADKEEAAARKALRDELIELGQLIPAEQVRATADDAVTQLRSRLELLAPTLAPALAATSDEAQVRILIRDEIEKALSHLSKKFGELARGAQ